MRYYTGKIYVFLGCLFLALFTIVSHHIINEVHPLIVAFYSFVFSLTILGFIRIKSGEPFYGKLIKHWKPVLILNISTAIDWILMFIALQYISGSLVNCFIFGIAPLATLFLSLKSYANRQQFMRDLIVTLFICVILFILAYIYYQNLGSNFSRGQLLLGIMLGSLSGLATAVTILCCKTLNQHGFCAIGVMKSRYLLLVLSAYLMLLILGVEFHITYNMLVICFILAIFFVTLPAFLLQKGLETTSPLIVVILTSSIPAMTYFLQLFESQYNFQLAEFSMILLLSVLICFATILRGNTNAI